MSTDTTAPKLARPWPEVRTALLDAIDRYGDGLLAADELLGQLVFHAEQLC